MGKPSNALYTDRIRSFAREEASERPGVYRTASPATLSTTARPPALPVDDPTRTTSSPLVARQQSSKPQSGLRDAIPLQDVGSEDKNSITKSNSPPDTKEHHEGDTTLTTTEKPSMGSRMKAGSGRFWGHTKNTLFHNYLNVLLIFVPIGIALNWVPIGNASTHATVVFSLNAIAIIPLAGLLSHATESVASSMGDTLASLLNVTFGNAVELIIFIIALVKNEISIVQASILGSILANLLLILGMAFLFGGLRFQEQLYNSTVTQMSACLLSLSVTSLLLPTAFHATFSDNALANDRTTKISRGTSVILLLVYILYLLFQLKSHAYMYESTPQRIIDEESHPGVLADFINSSSSSDNSSSSDSDDSTSSESSNRTKRRIKKMFRQRRRRKSNSSSVQANSVLSSIDSPEDKRSVAETDGSAPPENYFTLSERQRQDEHTGQSAAHGAGVLLSGDEADTDAGAPRVRDFSVEQDNNKASSPTHLTDIKGKLKLKKKHKKKRHHHKEHQGNQAIASPKPAQEVRFQPPPPETTTTTDASPSKRPFAKRQFTRVVPSMPPVFVAAQRPQLGTAPSRPLLNPVAMARSGMRRTNSLPTQMNQQYQMQQTQSRHVSNAQAEPAQRGGILAISEADVIAKDRETDPDGAAEPAMSRTAAVVLLLISTGLVAFCAELLVDSIPLMVASTGVSQAFIGLIILPIVGNAAEHVTAVTVACKNKMDLAIGVAVGSSIQIALFVTPFIVLLGWAIGKDMSLYFNLFDTVSLFVTAFVVNFLVLDGRSNYLEGALLIAAYIIIAVAAFFYPNTGQQSDVGGAGSQ